MVLRLSASPTFLLVHLSVAVFLAMISAVVLAPLLVDLSLSFGTSLAVAGQLAGAPAIAWAVTAPLAAPFADIYGRRLLLLTGVLLLGLGILGSGLAWSYGSMLAFRLLTGVGGAMVPPNCIAAVADLFPMERRGRAIGWLTSSVAVGAAFGVAISAVLLSMGGWRLPLLSFGGLTLVLWSALWLWFPKSQGSPGRLLDFIVHYREIGSRTMVWYVVATNALTQVAFHGMLGYITARLIQTYGVTAGETVLPLTIVGLGIVAGGLVGGRVAEDRRRLLWLAVSCMIVGACAFLIFMAPSSVWISVVLGLVGGGSSRLSAAIAPTLLLELAGRSRTTAVGFFAVSNQAGQIGGASVGGAMLALGGFPLLGIFCVCAGTLASVLVTTRVRNSEEFVRRFVLTTPESTTGN